ncbi:MAG: putative manganese-dependent inorganic diphosphatase [Gammaproteobacteria bacterium]|nr:putative manganese-dependent inorganic diphosphatase [Gammaproteobacteria bacterium]
MTKKLMIVGHKNPDTDSVCSAIAYAQLKNKYLGERAVPYRAGSLNPQTSFVLNYFGVTEPKLLSDLYPRLHNIMIQREELFILDRKASLLKAQELLQVNRFSFLPIQNADRTVAGKITALNMAGVTSEIGSLDQRECVDLDLSVLTKVISGRCVTLTAAPHRCSGRVAIHSLTPRIEDLSGQPEGLLLTTGDGDSIEVAISSGVRMIILTGCDTISERYIAMANAADTCIVVTSTSLLATVVKTTLCLPVEQFMETDFPTYLVSDKVRDVKRDIVQYHDGGFIVLDENKHIRGVITRSNFLHEYRHKVILVDHNEFSQSVNGIKDAEVIEIIDHHRLGNANTDLPITFINKTMGSTATIIAEMYRTGGFDPGREVAGLMLSAILSDTVILNSPTTTWVDQEIVRWLSNMVGVDIKEYGAAMFAAGSSLTSVSPREILKRDMKMYSELGWRFSISQIEMVGSPKEADSSSCLGVIEDMKSSLEDTLMAMVTVEDNHFGCLMITDITGELTLLLFAGDKTVRDVITHPEVAPNLFEMKAVLSRKKQALPYLIDCLRQLG